MTDRAFVAVEVLTGPSRYADTHEVSRMLADAFDDVTVRKSESQRGNTLIVTVPLDLPLLELPHHVARRLSGGAKAKMAIHAGGEDTLLTLMRTDVLEALVADSPSHTTAVLVSQGFFDDLDIEPASGARGVVAESRWEVVPAWLYSATPDTTVTEWESAILSLAVSSAGDQVVTGHRDGTVRRWQAETGAPLGSPLLGHMGAVRAVAVAGGRVISGGEDGTLRFWDEPTDEPLLVDTTGAWITAITVDPRGPLVISAGADGMVTGWDLTTHKRVWEFGMPASVHGVACADAHTVFVTTSGIEYVDPRDSPIDARPIPGYRNDTNVLVLSPDRQLLVSGHENGTIQVWRVDSDDDVDVIDAGTEVLSLAVTPDGKQVISGHARGALRRWSVDTGGQIGQSVGVKGNVNALAVTPDGQQIVSGGSDGVLRRWDVGTGALLSSLPPQRLADVVSDLESAEDTLGVSGDVHTVATVLAALSTKPPLSVALLGNWGAGKSSFMRQLRDRVELLSGSSARVGDRHAFAANLRQVTFNAWHYSDDHLWVGIVEHLFRELADKPAEPEPRRVAELTAKLDDEDAERQRLEDDLRTVQRIDHRRGWFGTLLAPVRSWPVFRAALRGAARELRHGGWRIWVGLLALAAGIAGVLVWHQFFAVVGVLGPVLVVWSQAREHVDSARASLLARKIELDEQIRDTTSELDRLDPSRRLDRLLTEITDADRYATYRGLTGRIHHDLRRLSDDLAAAHARWERNGSVGTPPLQRVVLYVDDLDRCTPERVVDVLQAVNLLLTMDLFMVVVAVDPRWLLRSLSTHHGELLTEPPMFGHGVGPVAYLDKIFHIPFALRPMGKHAVEFLHSLLPLAPTNDRAETPEFRKQAPAPRPVPRPSTVVTHRSAPNPARTAEQPTAKGLRVTEDEREFLGRLTPLLTTPRAIKKLTNLYRLLRLSVPRDELADFLTGPYQAAALLLAAIAGAPTEIRALLTILADQPDGNVVEAFKATGSSLGTRLAELVVSIGEDMPVNTDAATYRRWAREVARFGFETYDLYTGH